MTVLCVGIQLIHFMRGCLGLFAKQTSSNLGISPFPTASLSSRFWYSVDQHVSNESGEKVH